MPRHGLYYSPQKEVIAKFLQFCPITVSSNVVLTFLPHTWPPNELPVDDVANWLHRSRNYDAINAKFVKERILRLESKCKISNVSTMLSCLKKVAINFIMT